MAIESIKYDSPDEQRIGRRASNGLAGVRPTQDIFGGEVREPSNTFDIAPGFYVILPHRPLTGDEMAELETLADWFPRRTAPASPMSPNSSESLQAEDLANTDQSAEFIGTPPASDPAAIPPIGFVGDGTVPVSDGNPLPDPADNIQPGNDTETANLLTKKRSQFK
jgi:hypothetical protein